MGMSGFGPFSSEAPIFFKLVFGFILIMFIGTFAFVMIRGLSRWAANNASEPVTTSGKVVAKRTEVWGGSGDSRARTAYFITFEFYDGSRKELPVGGDEYGMLAEGDFGILSYQGTRFKDFRREMPQQGEARGL